MSDLEREDLKGEMLSATFKPMPSGELRFRMKPKGLLTRSVHLTSVDEQSTGWQRAHFHRNAVEVYQVISGSICYIFRGSDGDVHCVKEVDSTSLPFQFPCGVEHDIFISTSAEFLTWQITEHEGEGNPDRNGDDWWPASAQFEQDAIDAREAIRAYCC